MGKVLLTIVTFSLFIPSLFAQSYTWKNRGYDSEEYRQSMILNERIFVIHNNNYDYSLEVYSVDTEHKLFSIDLDFVPESMGRSGSNIQIYGYKVDGSVYRPCYGRFSAYGSSSSSFYFSYTDESDTYWRASFVDSYQDFNGEDDPATLVSGRVQSSSDTNDLVFQYRQINDTIHTVPYNDDRAAIAKYNDKIIVCGESKNVFEYRDSSYVLGDPAYNNTYEIVMCISSVTGNLLWYQTLGTVNTTLIKNLDCTFSHEGKLFITGDASDEAYIA